MITGRKRFNNVWELVRHSLSPSPLPADDAFGELFSLFLVAKLLEIDPTVRPSASELSQLDALHQYRMSGRSYDSEGKSARLGNSFASPGPQ